MVRLRFLMNFLRLLVLSSLLVMIVRAEHVHAEPAHEVERRDGIEFARPDGVSLLLDLYLPKEVESPPLIVWIHGGGWKGGTRESCKIAWAATHGYAIASIEYRLSQEAISPAQIHDCKGAIRWLRAHADEYGYDADRIVVGGSSAGGHLAALVGSSGGVMELEGETAGHPEESSSVQGVVDYYGPTDFVSRSKTHPAKTEKPGGGVYHLLGGKASENLALARLASPVTHLDSGDPPFLVLHGAKDKVVFPDQSEIFRDACEEKGVEVELLVHPDGGHGWNPPMKGEREAILESLAEWFGEVDATQ